MKALWVSLLLIPGFGVFKLQDDAEKLRIEKIKAIQDWSGHWKVSVQFSESAEFRGVIIKGDLDVKPDLGDRALRFDGTAQSSEAGSKKLTISGLVSFNHAAPYAEQGYTASFSWSEDGRVALAKGNFKDKNLVMDVSVFPGEKTPMSVRVVGDNPRRVICTLPKSGSAPAVDWMTITLTR